MAKVFDYSEIDSFLKALPEASSRIALDAAEPAMLGAVVELHGKLPQYADPVPGSGYKRTETLGRKFTEQVERSEDAIMGEIGTNVPYAPWVMGASFPGEEIGGRIKYQAKVHQKRWWQFETVIDANVDGAWIEFENLFWPEFVRRIQEV
jgi:hypothetical protein